MLESKAKSKLVGFFLVIEVRTKIKLFPDSLSRISFHRTTTTVSIAAPLHLILLFFSPTRHNKQPTGPIPSCMSWRTAIHRWVSLNQVAGPCFNIELILWVRSWVVSSSSPGLLVYRVQCSGCITSSCWLVGLCPFSVPSTGSCRFVVVPRVFESTESTR